MTDYNIEINGKTVQLEIWKKALAGKRISKGDLLSITLIFQ